LTSQLWPLVSLRTPHVTFPASTGSSRHIVQWPGAARRCWKRSPAKASRALPA